MLSRSSISSPQNYAISAACAQIQGRIGPRSIGLFVLFHVKFETGKTTSPRAAGRRQDFPPAEATHSSAGSSFPTTASKSTLNSHEQQVSIFMHSKSKHIGPIEGSK